MGKERPTMRYRLRRLTTPIAATGIALLLAACSVTVQGDGNPTAAPTAVVAAPTVAASGAPVTTAPATIAPAGASASAPAPAAATVPAAPTVATATRTVATGAATVAPVATATQATGTASAASPAATPRVGASATSAPIPTVAPVAGASPTAAPSSYGGVVRGDAICFPDKTDFCIAGRFRQYWEQHGALPLNGYPLSDEFTQTLEDGKPYTVQYFERTRLEYHPEFRAPDDVLLGQFGRRILADVPNAPTAAVPPIAGGRSFPETGHTVSGPFLEYWQTTGGLAQYGYPLSEVFTQRLEDGREYQVQYFERARFEVHPEIRGTNNILLGQFGRRILAEVRR